MKFLGRETKLEWRVSLLSKTPIQKQIVFGNVVVFCIKLNFFLADLFGIEFTRAFSKYAANTESLCPFPISNGSDIPSTISYRVLLVKPFVQQLRLSLVFFYIYKICSSYYTVLTFAGPIKSG